MIGVIVAFFAGAIVGAVALVFWAHYTPRPRKEK